MLRPTLRALPSSATMKDDCGLPFGVIVEPLAPLAPPNVAALDDDGEAQDLPLAEELARCESCGAYINRYCTFSRHHWRCALCGASTALPPRYEDSGERRELPELELDELELSAAPPDAPPAAGELPPRAAVVAVVDVCAGAALLARVRLALHAALAALPPTALFGLVVVGETIGAHLLGGAVPHVVRVPIPAEGEPTLPLRVAVPLRRMLAPAGAAAAAIAAAIETVRPMDDDDGGANGGAPRRRCGLGSAVRAILDGFAVDGGAASSRVLLFLGGPPDYGDGTLAPPPPPAGSAAAAAAATPLLSVTTEDPEAAAAARRPEDDARFSENAAPVLYDDGREPMSAAAKAAAAGRVAGRVGGRAAVAARRAAAAAAGAVGGGASAEEVQDAWERQLMRPQGGSGGRLWATLGDEAAPPASPSTSISPRRRMVSLPRSDSSSTPPAELSRTIRSKRIRRQRRRAMASPPSATAPTPSCVT